MILPSGTAQRIIGHSNGQFCAYTIGGIMDPIGLLGTQ